MRPLSLFRVNKQVHKESTQIFYRMNEFEFYCFLCFANRMLGGFPDGLDIEFNRFEVELEVGARVDYWKQHSLFLGFGKEDRRQVIRYVSLVGGSTSARRESYHHWS